MVDDVSNHNLKKPKDNNTNKKKKKKKKRGGTKKKMTAEQTLAIKDVAKSLDLYPFVKLRY